MADSSILSIDAKLLFDPTHKDRKRTLSAVRSAATEVGFMTVFNTDTVSYTHLTLPTTPYV